MAEMKECGFLPNGCMLYKKENEAGGYTYYSDEVGGGVFVWDTCLVDQSTLLAALVDDAKERYLVAVKKNENRE